MNQQLAVTFVFKNVLSLQGWKVFVAVWSVRGMKLVLR